MHCTVNGVTCGPVVKADPLLPSDFSNEGFVEKWLSLFLPASVFLAYESVQRIPKDSVRIHLGNRHSYTNEV